MNIPEFSHFVELLKGVNYVGLILQRMDSYYKRNYKDYFEFEEGGLRARQGQLSEAEKGILDWLQKNR